jgi:TPR repeat protein
MCNTAYLLFKLAASQDQDKFECLFDCAHYVRMCLDHNSQIRDAHFLMGYLYENGLAVDKNLHASFDHYSKASNLGHIKATTKMAHFLYSGIR